MPTGCLPPDVKAGATLWSPMKVSFLSKFSSLEFVSTTVRWVHRKYDYYFIQVFLVGTMRGKDFHVLLCPDGNQTSEYLRCPCFFSFLHSSYAISLQVLAATATATV